MPPVILKPELQQVNALAGASNQVSQLTGQLQNDSGWVTPAFVNSWKSFSELAYRRIGNEVRLRGAMNGGVSGKVAFTLPEGFQPVGLTIEPVIVKGSPGSLVLIQPSGTVTAEWSTGSEAVWLDGVTFFIN